MVHLANDSHGLCLHLTRGDVRFPLEWRAPEGFLPDDPSTWPQVIGRLEFVDGRIQYMPPCGEVQQDVATDATVLLGSWARDWPEFVVGSNEAGMIIGSAVRAADVGVWRRSPTAERNGFRRTAPILAVEVAGQDESEPLLREKAAWYLDAGVAVVWLVLPEGREVLVVERGSESRHEKGGVLPAVPALPGLRAEVAAFFLQIDRAK